MENQNERKDAWQPSEDGLLADIILDHIRQGSTQLKAFEEASARLGRTSAACGFRWNSEVRKRYEEAIQKAKSQRMELKNNKHKVSIASNHLPSDDVSSIKFALDRIKSQMKMMFQELDQRAKELEVIQKKLDVIMTPEQKVLDDYQSFVDIMKRAREIGALKSS
ncbi:RsfA family transcriptional regulator [Paenibacillus elgii]|uniref:RsfA family transcriptional regulator n=1 Tax=Paenibacillus elgii TaxID=189691 RepID=UPI00203B6A75|nr:RsfA family transcriptional regulator [Paenibacillus elgii]MCM3274193.1 RsfA family transcriptional regulator [Paenibacillus elgii]